MRAVDQKDVSAQDPHRGGCTDGTAAREFRSETSCYWEDAWVSLSFEHIVSRGAHGEVGNGVWQRLRVADREVWFGNDGTGRIKETFIRSIFFTNEQRDRWQTMPNKEVREDQTPRVEDYSAEFYGHGPRLARLATRLAVLASELDSTRQATLHGIAGLVGEALVRSSLARALHQFAVGLPGAEVLETATDQLGRSGLGIARIEHGKCVEMIFDPGSFELLGDRETLVTEADFAPAGTVIGWTSYLSREIVYSLPE